MTPPGTSAWNPIGPVQLAGLPGNVLPCAGRIDDLAVSPDFDGLGHPAMFLATPGGGIWRSSNFLSPAPTWTPLTGHLPGIATIRRVGINVISTLAVQPGQPRTIYAGAGGLPSALLKSTDGGDTWALVGAGNFLGAGGIWRVLVDPNGDVSVAFASGGFWQSFDGGTTWANAASPQLAGVEFHSAEYWIEQDGSVTWHVGVVDRQGKDRGGLWSFNGGVWTKLPMTLTNLKGQAFARSAINHITMSVDRSAGLCASLSQADDGKAEVGLLNLFKLVNGTWQPQWSSQKEWFLTQGGYVQGVCIAPDGRLYGGGIGLAQSAGGKSFNAINTDSGGAAIHVDNHAVLAYGGKIYVANDGGLFRFTPKPGKPGVAFWESLNSPSLTNFLSTGASIHPTNPGVVLVGNQDNGIARRGPLGQWTHSSFSNEREKLRFDPVVANAGQYAFAGNPNNGFYSSSDSGVSFKGFQPGGVPAPDPPPPFSVHPKNGARIIIGWMTVYETLDRGGNWSKKVTFASQPTALTYVGDHGVYAAVGNQLFHSTDDGKTWPMVPFNFGASILALCADSTNPDAIVVATGATVLRRVSAQAQWEDVTGNLGLDVRALALLPVGSGKDPWLFAGTGAGVFIASDLRGAQTQWIRYGTGFPDVDIWDLEISPGSRLLLAATWGRGALATQIALEPPSVEVQMDRDVCGVGAVEGTAVTLRPKVVGLQPPLSYQWQAVKTVILGPSTLSTVKVASPPSGTIATVSVTITDAEGAVVTGTTQFSSMSMQTARIIGIICRIRRFPNFPIDPLWDPLRDMPIRPLTRVDLHALNGLARELVSLTSTMLRSRGRR